MKLCILSLLPAGKKSWNKKPDNTFSDQTAWFAPVGLNLWAGTQSPTYTLHGHTMLQHLLHNYEYKTTLTGVLLGLVELSCWNVYLYIQMAWCHVMSHNVSWTNNVSHFSIRPATLKPPCSLYSHSNTQGPWLHKKGGTLCHHTEMPLWIKSQGYRGKLNQHCIAQSLRGSDDKYTRH